MDQGNSNGGYHDAELRHSRYREIEREVDSFGRIIGVRRLKPSEQTRISGLTPELTGADILEFDVIDKDTGQPTGEKTQSRMPHRMPLIIAASVCEIDRNPMAFPRSRQELDATFDMLDAEGVSAAGIALNRLMKRTEFPFEQTKEMAKNSLGTPSLDSNAGSFDAVSR